MSDYLLVVVAGTLVLFAGVLVWLLREHRKLKEDYRLLTDQVQSHKEDVAGLCAAAVVVDQRLAASDARLNDVLDITHAAPPSLPQPSSPIHDDQQPQGYDTAIQKIRRGAGVDELVKDCGLTRDEAVLLIRLHGDKR